MWAGNGLLKNKIPEANSDYIFSVVAEEYGLIGCTLILLIFFIISYQGFKKFMETMITLFKSVYLPLFYTYAYRP